MGSGYLIVIVIHAAPLVAVHAQLPPALTLTAPTPPTTLIEALVDESV